MSKRLNRRTFLSAAAASICVFPASAEEGAEKSSTEAAQDRRPDNNGSEVVLRFAVTSDIHFPGTFRGLFPGNSQAVQADRFQRLMTAVKDYSAKEPYKNFDALLVCGDMTNRGVKEELVPFCELMDEHLPPETKRVLCMGSHEYMGGNRALWEETCGCAGNSHQVINGYHFIALSPDDINESDGVFANRLDWVREQLEQAAAEDPARPIFFIQHYHISRPATEENKTASPQWLKGRATARSHRFNWGASDLYELFEQYPQIIDFSGHSHYPVTDPGTAWQGRFSAFGTGTICYAKMLEEPYNTTPEGRFDYAQFYIVEATRKNSVRLRIYDLTADQFSPREYFIEEPGNLETYRYTDARIKTDPHPAWKEGESIDLLEVTQNRCTFRIRQAVPEENIQSYRVVFRPKDENKPVIDERRWSQFYQTPMPEYLTFTFNQLLPNTQYRIEVYAVSFFDKKSYISLNAEITTR